MLMKLKYYIFITIISFLTIYLKKKTLKNMKMCVDTESFITVI